MWREVRRFEVGNYLDIFWIFVVPMCLPASQKAEKPSWQFVQMCLLNLDMSQIFSVLCFLQSSSSYIRFKCHQWPVCTVPEDGVPSALCGWWLSQHSVCELVPDAVRTTRTPRVHLTYVCVGDSNGHVRSVLRLDAAMRRISSFSGIVCFQSLWALRCCSRLYVKYYESGCGGKSQHIY